jgi:hypothetical protein
VLHEVEDEIEGTFVLPEVHRFRFVRYNFLRKKKNKTINIPPLGNNAYSLIPRGFMLPKILGQFWRKNYCFAGERKNLTLLKKAK